jgi:hypothetical protein
MEIGSFIELQLPKGNEYYSGNINIARLNSGRAAIYHAYRLLGCEVLWIPYYQCITVREFLFRKGVKMQFYNIDENFNPVNLKPKSSDAVLLVNYYGVMSVKRMNELANGYRNVIIDNSQAFFSEPLKNVMNVYSARKFLGVPDGAYVVGSNAERFISEYRQGHSSDTSSFLLQRIEYGCEGDVYRQKMVNDHRLDKEDIMKMSDLTRGILDGTEYEPIKIIRRKNYDIACDLFNGVNSLDPTRYYDDSCVPMVYPLVVEDDMLMDKLLKAKHFQGHWWSYIMNEMPDKSFEYWLSRYIIPITIDQRYGRRELEHIRQSV